MILIEYPHPNFKIELRGDQYYIFDSIRYKWLLLQEEEWVRQNFVQYLVQVMKYPKTLIALEKEISLGQMKKRFDILVYDTNHKPWMLIECKRPDVPVTDSVLHQVLRYSIAMPAQFLILTNGNDHYGWQKKEGKLQEIQLLPEFLTHH